MRARKESRGIGSSAAEGPVYIRCVHICRSTLYIVRCWCTWSRELGVGVDCGTHPEGSDDIENVGELVACLLAVNHILGAVAADDNETSLAGSVGQRAQHRFSFSEWAVTVAGRGGTPVILLLHTAV